MADHVQVPAYLIFAFCLGALHFEDYQFYYAAIKTTIQLVTSVGCLHEKVDPLSFPKDVNNLLGASREHLISNRSADSTQSRRRSSPFCAFSQVPIAKMDIDTRTFSPNQHFRHRCVVTPTNSSTCYCPQLRNFTEEIFEAYGEAAGITRYTTQLKQMVDGDVIPKKVRDRFRPRVVRFQILREYPMD